jgi:signal transduction histidine kinase
MMPDWSLPRQFPDLFNNALTIHDVKNNLAQLAGQAEARGDKATLAIALHASETLTRLLVFYKSENDLLQLAVVAHAPLDLMEELAGELNDLGGISIEIEASAVPALWYYDQTLVRMILANALDNARRFAHSRIVFSACEVDGFLAWTIHDDGAGYPDSVLVETDTTAPITPAGTGLGLCLAKQVAQMHENAGKRGQITLENAQGAVFILRLPS